MPDISATGTVTHDDAGFGFLRFVNAVTKTLLFAGTLPTTLEVKYTDDAGEDRVFEDGTITVLPASLVIGPFTGDVKIVSTGGSPNFNVTHGATERNS
jgi:hypothetical protein